MGPLMHARAMPASGVASQNTGATPGERTRRRCIAQQTNLPEMPETRFDTAQSRGTVAQLFPVSSASFSIHESTAEIMGS